PQPSPASQGRGFGWLPTSLVPCLPRVRGPCSSPCVAGGGWEGGTALPNASSNLCPLPNPPPLRRGGGLVPCSSPCVAGGGWEGGAALPKRFQQPVPPPQPSPASQGRGVVGTTFSF